MNFKRERTASKIPFRLVVVGGLQDGAEHAECPDEFAVGSTPECDYLLIDCAPASVYKFKRVGDGFSVSKNDIPSDSLLAAEELFNVGGCEIKLCLPVESTVEQPPNPGDDIVVKFRNRISGLMKTRSGVVSVVGASLMGVALTAALATSVLGESDDQALQTALASHGAKNVYVSRNNGDLQVKAQFENEATKASFTTWMTRRMGSEAKLIAEVASQKVVSTAVALEPPKLSIGTPMEVAFGCSRDCFDPNAISMIRVGKVPRVYFNNGSFLSVGDRIAKGVFIDEVADGSITISNGEKTVTLVVE
jgi:hypothetical protein